MNILLYLECFYFFVDFSFYANHIASLQIFSLDPDNDADCGDRHGNEEYEYRIKNYLGGRNAIVVLDRLGGILIKDVLAGRGDIAGHYDLSAVGRRVKRASAELHRRVIIGTCSVKRSSRENVVVGIRTAAEECVGKEVCAVRTHNVRVLVLSRLVVELLSYRYADEILAACVGVHGTAVFAVIVLRVGDCLIGCEDEGRIDSRDLIRAILGDELLDTVGALDISRVGNDKLGCAAELYVLGVDSHTVAVLIGVIRAVAQP